LSPALLGLLCVAVLTQSEPAPSAEAALPDAGELLPLDAGAAEEVPAPPDGGEPATVESGDAGVLAEPTPEPAPTQAETVVVGTPAHRTAGSVGLIKAEKLERFELDDPHAILQSVPGVYVRGEDGYGLRPNIGLRGASSDRSKKVTLMEDGVLLSPAPYSAPAAYYFPLITRMVSVRVLKGPSAIQYGPQTVGGAIDLVSRDVPSDITLGVDVAAGSYADVKAHFYAGAGTEDTGAIVEGVHLRSNGFKQLDGGGATGFERTELLVRLKHRFSLGPTTHTLSAKLGYAQEESDETYLGLSDADFRANPLRRYQASQHDHMSWWRTQVVASHELKAGALHLKTTFYRNDFHRIWRKVNHFRGADIADVLANPESPRNAIYYGVLTGAEDTASANEDILIGPNNREFVATGLQTTARFDFETGPLKHAVEISARYHFDSIRRRHSEDAFVVEGGELVSAGKPTDLLVANYEATHAGAFYLNDAVSVGPVTITPGLRVEVIRSVSDNQLAGTRGYGKLDIPLPGIGVHWAAWKRLGIFAGVYRGFSPPAPGEPETTLPELTASFEYGARWKRGDEKLEAVGFFNDYANLTDICTFSNGCVGESLDRQFSAGHAQIYGLEAAGEKTFKPHPLVSIPVSFAYTLTGTALLNAFNSADPQLGDVEVGDELPYVPAHQLNLAAGIEVWKFGVNAQFNLVSPMREEAGQGPMVPGKSTDWQATLDVVANVQITDWLELYFNARNLTDQHALVSRRPFGARPNAPRTFLGGFKIRY
jgi:Fe(3+) dicitrate transport protein